MLLDIIQKMNNKMLLHVNIVGDGILRDKLYNQIYERKLSGRNW